MKKVARFESNDGREFKTKSQCKHHEKGLLFRDWYKQHILYGSYNIGTDEIIEWLQKHRLQVLELLNGE